MCGRYALALRPSQILRMLRDDDMPVYEAPDDPDEDDGGRNEGDDVDDLYNGPRQSYNFAPGSLGVVYRANVPDWGAGPRSRRDGQTSTDANNASSTSSKIETQDHEVETDEQQTSTEAGDVHYKLQTMKWGLIPFWTKRNPGYGSLMKTINCRDDSLAQSGGMWSSMKGRKRCVVVAQGFYEWLKKDGGREKVPHYVKRKDGKLMCFAGLWDVVQYENEQKQYTYTIITTESNKQLRFLHDRMPVILENGSERLRKWLDPKRYEWSKELQSLLQPYEGELEVYPVSKDVGKVGNNSPTFIIPVNSKENKSNIANFFAKGAAKKGGGEKGEMKSKDWPTVEHDRPVKEEQPGIEITEEQGFVAEDAVDNAAKVNPEDEKHISAGVKREAEDSLGREPPRKKPPSKTSAEEPRTKGVKASSLSKGGKQKISATSNKAKASSKSPAKAKPAGTQKITNFFANSS